MLLELRHIRQIPNDYFRRCFADENFHLLIWYKPDQTIYGFQLSYDRTRNPRALTWTQQGGFSHDTIDDGESSPLANRSPMLRLDADFDATIVLPQFRRSAQSLPGPVRKFILNKIRQFDRRNRACGWKYALAALPCGFMAGVGFFLAVASFSDRWRERAGKK